MATHIKVFFFCLLLVAPLNVSAQCKLQMGWDDWKPYQYLNSTGQLVGVHIELVKEIAIDLNCDISFEEHSWKRLLVAIEAGVVDFTASASLSKSRQRWAYFSDPYIAEKLVLITRRNESANYPMSELADISTINFKLGIADGFYIGPQFERLMQDRSFSNLVQKVASQKQNPQKLLRKRIDGYIGNKVVEQQSHQALQLTDYFEIHPLPIYATDLHFMFSKKTINYKLVERFNQSLAKLKASHKYQLILDKYISK